MILEVGRSTSNLKQSPGHERIGDDTENAKEENAKRKIVNSKLTG